MKMKHFFLSFFLSFLLISLGTDSFASSKLKNNNQVSLVESNVLKKIIEVFQLDCGLWFYMPCPPGSHGDGTLFWSGRDCETGEPSGSNLTLDFGCENDEDTPLPPIVT